MRRITRSPLVVGRLLRALLALPQPVQRLLGGTPIVVDGQQLDTSWQFLRWVVGRTTAGRQITVDAKTVRFSQHVMDIAAQGRAIRGARYRPIDMPRPDGTTMTARLYSALTSPPSPPLLLFFHGGGFVSGSLNSHDRLCAQLAAKAEVSVLAVDYRLAPEHPFPQGLDDCDLAYRFVLAHASELAIDQSTVAIGGDSAGANLALTVAYEHRHLRPPAALLLFYPPVDPAARTRSRTLFGAEFFLTNEAIATLGALYLGGSHPADNPRARTPQTDLGGMPPTYLVTAGFDPLRDEGEQFGAQLSAAGVPVVLRREPDLTHGFASSLGVGPRPREAVSEAAAGLRTMLTLSDLPSKLLD